MEYNGAKYWYDKNLQGDIVGIRNSAGTLVAQYVYDAWGKILRITDKDGNDVSGNPDHIANINPFRYRGYYYDVETGWYYLNARYYDPNVGRFLSPDTILGANGGLQGYNLFAYCNNNPVMFADPSGRSIVMEMVENIYNKCNEIIAVTTKILDLFKQFDRIDKSEENSTGEMKKDTIVFVNELDSITIGGASIEVNYMYAVQNNEIVSVDILSHKIKNTPFLWSYQIISSDARIIDSMQGVKNQRIEFSFDVERTLTIGIPGAPPFGLDVYQDRVHVTSSVGYKLKGDYR